MRDAWIHLLLRLHPRRFREEHGPELRELVADEAEEAARRGALVLFLFILRTTADLLGSAIRLRVHPTLPGAGGAARSGSRLPALALDVFQAFRNLRRTPLVTGVVILTLSLGIGFTTSFFSVADALLLRPLEYRDADRLVEVTSHVTADGSSRAHFSGGDFRDIRDGVDALEDAVAVAVIRQNLVGGGTPRQVEVGWVSPHMLAFLGVQPVVGRAFTADDPPGTVLLAHELWVERFGGEPDVAGRTIRLDGRPHVVVGVLPPGFRLRLDGLSPDVDLWKNPDDFWSNGDLWGSQGPGFALFRMIGRVREGAGPNEVREQLAAVEADLRTRFPEYERAELRLSAVPLRDALVDGVRGALLLLGAATLTVLLIACANVAGILLVRARGRMREMAVRRALGASRSRLASLLLGESLVLAILGAAGGAVVAAVLTETLVRLAPPLPRGDTIGIDHRVLVFALLVGAACTLLVGLVPGWSAARSDPAGELGGRGTTDGGGRARNALVTGQLALAIVLLVATGLLGSSLLRLRAQDPGFDVEGVSTFAVSLPGSRYERDEAGRFLVRLEERLRALPGVRSAGVMWPVPFGSRWQSRYEAGPGGEGQEAWADYRVGTAGYFQTLGIPLLEGRLTGQDDPPHSVVISRTIAERSWPGRSAVGRTVLADPWGGGPEPFEVVGVVEDVRYSDLREPALGALYFDVRSWAWTDWEFDIVVAGSVPFGTLVQAARGTLTELDPEVPLADASPLSELLERETAAETFALSLVGAFSGVAALLALIGLYGTVSYAVSTRSREIGVRMAMGAARSRVLRLVMGQALRLVAIGVPLGMAGAFLAGRFLQGWLYQVEPGDPLVLAGVAGGLGLLALAASWIPARRAASTDPVSVLRAE